MPNQQTRRVNTMTDASAQPPSRTIDAVIFDFGGVLASNGRPSDVVRRFPHDPADVVMRVMMGEYGQDTDHPWHRLERGEISMDDYRLALAPLVIEAGLTPVATPAPEPGQSIPFDFIPNEPVIELFPRQEDMSNYGDWLRMMRERTPLLDAYMAHFAEVANNLGYGTGLGNFSTGTPANLKPGDYPTFDWFPRTAKLLEQTRGRNALVVHEYWTAAQGPEGWWDWHTCRFFHYQVNCDIDVLECGVEEAITGKPHQGWQGQLTAAQYAAQMDTYLRRARTDSRFRGATPFTLDGDKQWATFYVEGCVPEFLQLARDLDAKPPAATYTVHLPSLLSGTDPNANWVRSYPHVLRIEGGLSLDPNDPGNWRDGKLVGTQYGISAAVWGGQYDIPNLTEQQALDIYRQHYWRAAGCENLPWPLCLVVFDTAVNHGVGVAQELLGQHSDPVEYLAHRMLVYVRLANWSRYGVAWGNRVKALLDVVRT